jgi:hypothetical protein
MLTLNTANTAPTELNLVNVTASNSESAEPDAKLGWILIHKRWISPAQLQMTLTQQLNANRPLGELLLEQSLISEVQLQQALKEQYWRRNGYWVI